MTFRKHYKAIMALGLLSLAWSTYAQTASVSGNCSLGGTQATISGQKSTNYLLGIVPSCTITVYLTGTTTLATIYADANNTPLSNPFTANALLSTNPGGWIFWANAGTAIDVVASGGFSPINYMSPVTLFTDIFPSQCIGCGYPFYNIAAYGAQPTVFTNPTGFDNGPIFNTILNLAAVSGNGAWIFVPNTPGQFFYYSTQVNASNSKNIHIMCGQPANDVSSAACGLMWDGSDSVTPINATGSQGFDLENVMLKFNSTTFSACYLDISGSATLNTNQAHIHGSHFSGPGNNTTGTGICINPNNNGGGSDTSSETLNIYQNIFNNLGYAIKGPNGGATTNANNIIIGPTNSFLGPFADAPILAGGQDWHIHDNTFEPIDVSKTIAKAVRYTPVGLLLLDFGPHNLIADGQPSGFSSSIVIDTSPATSGAGVNQSVDIHDNTISGFGTLLKASAAMICYYIAPNNEISAGSGNHMLDLNGNSPQQCPNGYMISTYPFIDSSTGNNFPGISGWGFYVSRYGAIGSGQSALFNLGALSPSSTQANIQGNTVGAGTVPQNAAYKVWFNGQLMDPTSLSGDLDPDFNGNADFVMLHGYGFKNCAENSLSLLNCEYLDTSGILHYRTETAVCSIAFTNNSTAATAKCASGQYANIGVGNIIGDTSCSGSSCVPVGTTVTAISGTSITLSNKATATSSSVGSPISLTAGTLNATTVGQSTLVGTNTLTARSYVLISGFSGSLAPLNSTLPYFVAGEQLSGSQFNVFTANPGSGTFSDTGTATIVNPPASFWKETGSYNIVNGNLYQGLGIVATRGMVFATQNGSYQNAMDWHAHYARTAIGANSLRCVIGNFLVSSGVETDAGATTWKCSIEYPLGATPVLCTWGGSSSITNTGPAILTSDVCPNPAIPNGAVFRTRTYQSNSSGIKYNGNASYAFHFDSTGTYDGFAYGTTGSPTPDKTTSGGVTSSGGNFAGAPIGVVGPTAKPGICLMGDSREFGTLDVVADNTLDVGQEARSIGPSYAYTQLGIPGDYAQSASTNYAYRGQFTNLYCSAAIDEYGINDVELNTAAATIAGYRSTLAGLLTVPVYGTTVEPRTATTDSWSTLTNQSFGGTPYYTTDPFNDLVRAGISGEVGYFDIANLFDPQRVDKWPVNPSIFTTGGISASITNCALTSNVATMTAANQLRAGMYVLIAGLSTCTWANAQTVQIITTGLSRTQFEFAFTHANVSSTPDTGTAVQAEYYTIDGLHESFLGNQFIKQSGIISPATFVK